MNRSVVVRLPLAALLVAVVIVPFAARAGGTPVSAPPAMSVDTLQEAIMRGRLLVAHHGCGDCHGGFNNPDAPGFLAGMMDPTQEFQIGPFKVRSRNITPDNTTGIGRFTERQLFNALRYGLRPGETPDVEITSSTPGEGNFPATPKYLAVPMPWPAFRHMSDRELWDIATYLKRGVKPVRNQVPDSEGPPDFWAGEYTAEKYGTWPMKPFPGTNETAPQP